jgi:hypothetical protein
MLLQRVRFTDSLVSRVGISFDLCSMHATIDVIGRCVNSVDFNGLSAGIAEIMLSAGGDNDNIARVNCNLFIIKITLAYS